MSSHYIFVCCSNCKVSDEIYTGSVELEHFMNNQWESESITSICDACEKLK